MRKNKYDEKLNASYTIRKIVNAKRSDNNDNDDSGLIESEVRPSGMSLITFRNWTLCDFVFNTLRLLIKRGNVFFRAKIDWKPLWRTEIYKKYHFKKVNYNPHIDNKHHKFIKFPRSCTHWIHTLDQENFKHMVW